MSYLLAYLGARAPISEIIETCIPEPTVVFQVMSIPERWLITHLDWTSNIPASRQLPLITGHRCQYWVERRPSQVTSISPKSPNGSSLDRAALASLASGDSSFIIMPFLDS